MYLLCNRFFKIMLLSCRKQPLRLPYAHALLQLLYSYICCGCLTIKSYDMKENTSFILPVVKQFDLHSRLFNNVLEGIEGDAVSERLNEHVNHAQWIAGHLANSRYHLAPLLGLKMNFPYEKSYTDRSQPPPHNRAIDPSVKYPSISEIKESWNELSKPFSEKMALLSIEQLTAESGARVPTGKTVSDLFSFIASHESYHIGQLSIIRKYLGLDAMSYK